MEIRTAPEGVQLRYLVYRDRKLVAAFHNYNQATAYKMQVEKAMRRTA